MDSTAVAHPLNRATTAPSVAPVLATPGDPTATAPLRVLLAEDNVVNQRVAVGLLGRRGHTVTVANNGLEAIAATEGSASAAFERRRDEG